MAFEVIPSLFLFNGACVHFPHNDPRKLTTHPVAPLAQARQFIAAGAKVIDIVDIDAVRSGYPSNLGLTCRLIGALDVPVQVGGGIRDLSIMETLIQAGAHRLVLGTAAVCDPHFVEESVQSYGEQIAIALDTRQGRVAVRGGTELSVRGAQEVYQNMFRAGVRHYIYSDLGRKATVNLGQVQALLSLYPGRCQLYIKAVATVQDLQDLADLQVDGLAGAILGEQLYTGEMTLEQARWAVSQERLRSSFLPPVSDNFA